MEIAVHDIAVRLARKGHEIIVYSRMDKTPGDQVLPQNIRLIRVPTLDSKYLGAFIHALLCSLHLLLIKADIVHFQALGPSFFSFIPRLSGKKSVVTIHAQDWKRRKWNFCARFFLRCCEFAAVFFPNKTITVSRALREYYQGRFAKPVIYIPNAVEIPEAAGQIDPRVRDIILFAGRLVPEKRVEHLIRAYNDISPDMDLVIAGEALSDPGYAAYLRGISAGNKRVNFIGQVGSAQLVALYRRAYVFVLPSEIEGAPLALLEAMSHGVCPITADIPECAEIAGNTAVYFRAAAPGGIKDKLKFLLEYPQVCREKGIKARERVMEKYSWSYVIEQLESAYAALKRP